MLLLQTKEQLQQAEKQLKPMKEKINLINTKAKLFNAMFQHNMINLYIRKT